MASILKNVPLSGQWRERPCRKNLNLHLLSEGEIFWSKNVLLFRMLLKEYQSVQFLHWSFYLVFTFLTYIQFFVPKDIYFLSRYWSWWWYWYWEFTRGHTTWHSLTYHFVRERAAAYFETFDLETTDLSKIELRI